MPNLTEVGGVGVGAQGEGRLAPEQAGARAKGGRAGGGGAEPGRLVTKQVLWKERDGLTHSATAFPKSQVCRTPELFRKPTDQSINPISYTYTTPFTSKSSHTTLLHLVTLSLFWQGHTYITPQLRLG